MTNTVRKVDIASVSVGDRKRELGDITSLAQSIRDLGLLNPITILRNGSLVAGCHRLAACKSLGWKEIDATIVELDALNAELAEIDENLIRNELHWFDRDKQLARRKEIYETLHPGAKAGGDRKSEKSKDDNRPLIPSFVADTAMKTSYSPTTVKESIQRAKTFTEEQGKVLKRAAIPQTDATKLARLEEPKRAAVIKTIATGKAKNVKEAVKVVKQEERQEEVKQIQQSAPAAIKELKVEPGQTWRLGNHLLYCGDSSSAQFISLAKEHKVMFAFADPPYNAGVADWDKDFEWNHDYLLDLAPIVAVTPGISAIKDFMRITNMAYKWSMSYWIDNGMTRGALGFGNWIYVALFSKGSIHRNSQDIARLSITNKDRDELEHKGRKPLDMMHHIIGLFSKEGETVIDPFLGTGSTLIVCEKTGRHCIGAEINPDSCKYIIEWWENLSGKKAEVM